jgi:beta-lactam-binding protein with PASTA domain
VPALVGLTPAQAQDEIRSKGLLPGTPTNYSGFCGDPATASAPQNEGRVCTQSFPAGSMQAKGTTVGFTIYVVGPVSVPNVVGLLFPDASKQITAAKLQLAPQKSVDSQQPAGQVLDQNPKGYVSVDAGSQVTLTVSSGKTGIPNVVNQPISDAASTLNQAGFANLIYSPTLTSDISKKDIVFAMTPSTGSFPSTQSIKLSYYKYQALPPCPTPTVTDTATPPAGSTTPPPPSSTPPVGPPTCTPVG